MKVYLAGGFAGDWHKNIEALPGHTYINPKKKEYLGDVSLNITPREYVAWDLLYIDKCDVVFAYLQNTNPSLVGVLAEIGYAKAKGKLVIMVLEPDHIFIQNKYFEFVKHMVDVTYPSLSEGIEFLSSINQ